MGEESPNTTTWYIEIYKYQVKAVAVNGRRDRESVTETIPPIVIKKTLKVFMVEEVRVKRVR